MQRSSCPFALALALASISLYRSLLFVVVGVGKIKARIKRGKCKKNIYGKPKNSGRKQRQIMALITKVQSCKT